MSYQEYQELLRNGGQITVTPAVDTKAEKKAKKKAKKAAKLALKQAKADAEHAMETYKQLLEAHGKKVEVEEPVIPTEPEKREWTEAEKEAFRVRIDNEKQNISRLTQNDPEEIIKFCRANKRDEKNPAIRFARRDALKWANSQVVRPY